MVLLGKVFKNKETGKYWAIEIPSLEIYTQGKSKADALNMAEDAVAEMLGKNISEVTIASNKDDEFYVSCADTKAIVSAVLKARRLSAGLTMQEVADQMGEKSVTGYARYEQGTTEPGFDKLNAILDILSTTDDKVALKIG